MSLNDSSGPPVPTAIRYSLSGPPTIAGIIILGGGVLITLILLPVMILESRPLNAWLALIPALAPLYIGGLWTLRIGLKAVTLTGTHIILTMPLRTVRSIAYEAATVSPGNSFLARIHLEIRGPDSTTGCATVIRIPINVQTYPDLEAELIRRAPQLMHTAMQRNERDPNAPIVGSRRLEFSILIGGGTALGLAFYVLIWVSSLFGRKPMETDDWIVGILFTLLGLAVMAGGIYYACRGLTYIKFTQNDVTGKSLLRELWRRPAGRLEEIEIQRIRKTVKGMEYFEDHIFLHFAGAGPSIEVQQLLAMRTGYRPRDLAAVLAGMYAVPLRENASQ